MRGTRQAAVALQSSSNNLSEVITRSESLLHQMFGLTTTRIANGTVDAQLHSDISSCCQQQRAALSVSSTAVENGIHELANQQYMHSICTHENLFSYLNTDNLTCDICEQLPTANNGIVKTGLDGSFIGVQQAHCGNCFQILCFICTDVF